MSNLDNTSLGNIIDIKDLKLKRLMNRNHSIREFGDRYEYCFIKEYENKYDNFACDSIQFEDCFVQLLTVKGERILVSIDFNKDIFEMEEVIYYLELYGFTLLKEGEYQIKEAYQVLEAKKFNGTPIVLYERGTDIVSVDLDELMEITEEFVYNKYRINTVASKSRTSIKPKSKIVLNDEEIDYIPEIEISPYHDLIISNGNIIVANYIGNYFGCIGFYLDKEDDFPVSWIYDKDTTVYIDIHEDKGKKIIMIDHNYAICLEDLYDSLLSLGSNYMEKKKKIFRGKEYASLEGLNIDTGNDNWLLDTIKEVDTSSFPKRIINTSNNKIQELKCPKCTMTNAPQNWDKWTRERIKIKENDSFTSIEDNVEGIIEEGTFFYCPTCNKESFGVEILIANDLMDKDELEEGYYDKFTF